MINWITDWLARRRKAKEMERNFQRLANDIREQDTPNKDCDHDWELFSMPSRHLIYCHEFDQTWTYRCKKCRGKKEHTRPGSWLK